MMIFSSPWLQLFPDLTPPRAFGKGKGNKVYYDWRTTGMIRLSVRYLLEALLNGKQSGGRKFSEISCVGRAKDYAELEQVS